MCHNKTKRPADLSIVKRLGGFSWCKGTAFIRNSQTFLKKKKKSSLRNIFWNNESYAIKHYLKMFADLASATLKQVADWFVWLASTLGKFNATELRRADHEVHDIADGRYDGRIQKFQQGMSR